MDFNPVSSAQEGQIYVWGPLLSVKVGPDKTKVKVKPREGKQPLSAVQEV